MMPANGWCEVLHLGRRVQWTDDNGIDWTGRVLYDIEDCWKGSIGVIVMADDASVFFLSDNRYEVVL